MEGFPQKVPNEMHSYGYGTTAQHYGSVAPGVQNVVDNLTPSQSYVAQTHSTSAQGDNSSGGIISTPGTSLQEDFGGGGGGEVIVPHSGGRKKKKKHKSGDNSGSSVKPEVMDEEGLIDAAIPLLSENQGVEDLLFNASLPSSGGTIVGGQYLLNNSLLDQILTEKKLQLLQSPEVMEWLKKHMKDK